MKEQAEPTVTAGEEIATAPNSGSSLNDQKVEVLDNDVKAVFEIFDGPEKEERKVKFADSGKEATCAKSDEYASEDGDDSDWDEGFANSAHEIGEFETELNQFQRINILFTQISTAQFVSFVRNENREYTQEPSNHARDFFLRNIETEPFLKGVKERAQVERELTQMVYLLDIRRLQMKLDPEDWLIISRVIFSLVASSLAAKCQSDARSQEQIARLQANVGELTEQEQILQRFLM